MLYKCDKKNNQGRTIILSITGAGIFSNRNNKVRKANSINFSGCQ